MLRNGLPKRRVIGKFCCYACGKRYYRRNRIECWSITQRPDGQFVYERREARLCLDCESRDVRRLLMVTQPRGASTKPEPVSPSAPATRKVSS